ncbi:hypothetical protein ACNOYE_09655 [Nannocystaceae bacterium ST9]
MSARPRLALGLLLGSLVSLATGSAYAADNSLAVPLFGDRSEALWPIEIAMEVVDVETGEVVVPRRDLVVADGQHTTFSEVVATPRGQRAFELAVTVRHHAEGAIEFDYELAVRDAAFEDLTWSDYLLDRLDLAPRPELGPVGLAAARADIVETKLETLQELLSVGGDRYEIRLHARSLRG